MWNILEKRPFFRADMAGLGKYRMADMAGLGSKVKYVKVDYYNCNTISLLNILPA